MITTDLFFGRLHGAFHNDVMDVDEALCPPTVDRWMRHSDVLELASFQFAWLQGMRSL